MYRKAGNTWYLVCCQARQILAWNDVVCSGDDMMTNVTFSVTAYQSAFLLVSSATITLAAAARAISPLNLPFHRVGRRRPLASLHAKGGARSRRHPQFFRRRHGAQRAKIIKKVHKPPRNHYIEWSVFYDIGLNCESQGEKGRTWKKYNYNRVSSIFFFLYMLSLSHPGIC